MKVEFVSRKKVSHVQLEKDEKHHLGMTIADGVMGQAGPVVKKIKSKSPAGRSFAINDGDVILSFNGNSTVGTRSKDVIRMIKEAGNSVDFELQYEMKEMRISEPVVYRKRERKMVLYKVDESFGFVLRKEDLVKLFADDYPVVSNIKVGSHAHRQGLIQEGDRLLKVDDVNLSCLSLREIAHLLQAKRKAEFVFQYDVGTVDITETGRKVDLDIDVPNADLGVCLITGSEDSGLMYIEKIRLGSIAERCGILSKGDIILSIDEIDARFLTASKASTLLQNCSKCCKISFIPSKRKKKSPPAERWTDHSDSTAKATAETTEPCDEQQNPFNTPESSSIGFSNKQDIFPQKSCFGDQMKFVCYLQNIVRVVQDMKQIQNEIKIQKKALNASGFCTHCGESQHSVKMCVLFLAKVSVACSQSTDMLQNLVSHFIFHPFRDKQKGELQANGKEVDNTITKVNKVELIHILKETLPDLFSGEYYLKEQLLSIANKIKQADRSCSICDFEIQFIWITTQKLLLLLSVDYDKHDLKLLINQLLCCILKTDSFCNSSSVSKSERCHNLQYENPLNTPSVHFTDDTLLDDKSYSSQTDLDSESIGVGVPVENNLTSYKIKMQRDYLKITHIQSLSASEKSSSDNDLCEADKDAKTLVGSECLSLQENKMESSISFPKFEYTVSNRSVSFNRDDKVLNQVPTKLSRSFGSILKTTKAANDQPEVPHGISQNTTKCKVPKTGRMTQGVPGTSSDYAANRLPANHKSSSNRTHISNFDERSTASSITDSSQKNSQGRSSKIRTDTIEVKMLSNGEGFGLGLGVKFIPSKSSAVLVVQSIQPRSPSQRSGVLKMGDRIVAINRRSILGLTPKELQIVKKKTFLADTITLTVEFDILEAEIKVGTFDVVLDKTLKIGLIFEDMQRGYPMVVSGVVKGSGAHRCGQLFPGDKIKFFRCIRNEEFDPVSCNYSKEESVLITVQRDKVEGPREKPANASPCYLNPCFSHKDSVPRRGLAFVVRSSAIHVVEGTDSLVLDQEVTLFRDPVSWDFGFLVGENPETGRAYVTDVRPEGPASKSGVMKKFDRILEVNGVSVHKHLEQSVLSLLSQANHKVDLLIRRLYEDDSHSV